MEHEEDNSTDEQHLLNIPFEVLLHMFTFLPSASVLLAMTTNQLFLALSSSCLLSSGLNQTDLQQLELSSSELKTLLRYADEDIRCLNLLPVKKAAMKNNLGEIKRIANGGHFTEFHLNAIDLNILDFVDIAPKLVTLTLKDIIQTTRTNNDRNVTDALKFISKCTNLRHLTIQFTEEYFAASIITNQQWTENIQKIIGQLESLTLVNALFTLEKGNQSILEFCTSLEQLYIIAPKHDINEQPAAVEYIFSCLQILAPRLRVLDIQLQNMYFTAFNVLMPPQTLPVTHEIHFPVLEVAKMTLSAIIPCPLFDRTWHAPTLKEITIPFEESFIALFSILHQCPLIETITIKLDSSNIYLSHSQVRYWDALQTWKKKTPENGFPNVKRLCIQNTNIDASCLLHMLQSFPQLTELKMNKKNALSEHADTVTKLVQELVPFTIPLTSVDLSNSSVPIALVTTILNASKMTLRRLILDTTVVTSRLLEYTKGKSPLLETSNLELPELRYLSVSYYRSNQEHCTAIQEFFFRLGVIKYPKLRSVNMIDNWLITAPMLNKILNTSQEVSDLQATQCDDETLQILSSRNPTLYHLNVNAEKITTQGLLKLPTSARVTLESIRITEANLDPDLFVQFLQDCRGLTHISINLRKVGPTDEFLELLSRHCPHLEKVLIGGTGIPNNPVTGEGFKKFVESMSKLRIIVLDMAPLSAEELSEFLKTIRERGRIAPKVVLARVSSSYNSQKMHIKRNDRQRTCELM